MSRSIAILGGRPDRNIPEIARGIYHIPQERHQRFSIPAGIQHLVVLTDFIGHSASRSAIQAMKARGGHLYFVRGSRSAIDRVLRERVLPAAQEGGVS